MLQLPKSITSTLTEDQIQFLKKLKTESQTWIKQKNQKSNNTSSSTAVVETENTRNDIDLKMNQNDSTSTGKDHSNDVNCKKNHDINDDDDNDDASFLCDMNLYLYSFGFSWKYEQSVRYLKECLEWRREFQPQKIQFEEIEEVAKLGFIYPYGKDRKGRPVVYVCMNKDTLPNDEQYRLKKFKFLCFIMEQCIGKMKKASQGGQIYNIMWIVDIKNLSIGLSTMKQGKDMFFKLGDYYCERLGLNAVVNYSWTLGCLWSFVKLFLYKETVEKINFISNDPKERKKELSELIDPDQLLKEYGGNAAYTFDIQDFKNWTKQKDLY